MRSEKGAIALEFLFLFPLVIAMLYAAAAYGMLFFGKYEMQSVVDQAASSALRVDRSRLSENDLSSQIVATAKATLEQGWASKSESLTSGTDSRDCEVVDSAGISFLTCVISRNNQEAPMVPQLTFGFLGKFPPMPDAMRAEATMAF
ncbi:pilus assembly protein [Marinobacter sp. TBZ242]|uniref:Pilus assembly protein n=1 Tax=Marinobacter azerbaijanicus TaxID=3050455 RepID=A0ABT7IDY0_9GAMM|nr:TadE/TadG family type IV pilus assembly protein [Marinobacter sp. TBZ242]MDL0431878.1 pilus assembly protein [Marinobacter sp. TBZ242]